MKSILFVVALASTLTGCLRSTNFQCETSAQCGAEGVCEADKFCSFPSSSCTSGRVYGDNSGPSSNECVGGAGNDGGTEPTIGNEMPGGEPVATNCPGTGYAALPNSGPRGHHYKALMNLANWSQHRDACAAEGTFLAFPDGTNATNAGLELAALRVVLLDAAWVGINDLAVEGAYVNSLNMPVSAVTGGLINTGGGNPNGVDCLIINTTTMEDANCGDTRKAACECIP